jgi:hypothetical protein
MMYLFDCSFVVSHLLLLLLLILFPFEGGWLVGWLVGV